MKVPNGLTDRGSQMFPANLNGSSTVGSDGVRSALAVKPARGAGRAEFSNAASLDYMQM